ncbi:MAG TPA: DUF3182 family protein [Burkholderiaceae bacterium]|nr:DUF3182 family protein [Burkholderiaceae bacterium]
MTRVGAPRPVAFHDNRRPGAALGHDALTRRALARLLAEVLDVEYLGEPDVASLAVCRALVVPHDTLLTLAEARRLGIRFAQHIFGGVVPRPFVATKVIGHPLARTRAIAPRGWSRRFAHLVGEVVLPGCAAFDARDAILAGERLLRDGAIRLKEAGGVGGAGQHVVENAARLRDVVAALERAALMAEGIVIERNLLDVTTLSVGRVQVGPLVVSYVGTQSLVKNHRGHDTYGGSHLSLVRGDAPTLLESGLAPMQHTAVTKALAYHRAALACFRGLIATRANYDVACGRDAKGHLQCGVLEQSWRIGGATGAELLAVRAFRDDPSLAAIEASTHEVYGDPGSLPEGAHVLYDGLDDAGLGRLVKYAQVHHDGHTRRTG